ncbi:MAG TPA: tannase/feruloyl esterase family alpha/beta hydrolase [Steroidobacteraceae bacterium]|nr:tannase/feruloyl esterase family alpha/beta hydrolase [Steroidobacteraceae bacterium]
MRVAWLLAACLPAASLASGDCASLAGHETGGARVLTARAVAPDGAASLPAYCELTAEITPVPGSRIGVVARLPENWNGKLLGLGGGGWAGDVTLARARPGLRLGYATVQTDAGHQSTGLADIGWQTNPEALTDFAWRAVHLTAIAGRQLANDHYGHAARRAYFLGCSTGGRQGLVEAQRFPADYDGIVSGAPVYSFLTQTTMMYHGQAFSAPGAALTTGKLQWLNATMLAACDAADGLADGVITDPRRCQVAPATLRCALDATADDTCLTIAQAAALERVYASWRNRHGETVAYPLMRGSEAGWSRFITTTAPAPDALPTLGNTAGGLATLRGVLLGNPNFDLAQFDPDADLARLRASSFARAYDATDANLAPFTNRGGKLLLWHGMDDPGPSPWATVDYYEQARRAAHDAARFNSAVRLYLAPGVQHCGGGPGADDFDLLSSLDAWVSSGSPPAIVAHNRGRQFARPLCAWPALPHYKGGDAADAASFSCQEGIVR